MRLEPPRWWYGERISDRLLAAFFAPLGGVYGLTAEARFKLAKPYRSKLPVICIGNFTLGGAGKTPLAIEIARMVKDWGGRPVFLTRGYGGNIAGPHHVDPEHDTALKVGDEPILLALAAPTFVARDRAQGAREIENTDATVIIMDDGFQNPALLKDLCLIAVDAGLGLGNRRVFPAGPLRAPLNSQLGRADAVISIGVNEAELSLSTGGAPILNGQIRPAGNVEWLRDAPVVAFCGIGRPEKFFDSLRSLGARIVKAVPFPDHHFFTPAEAASLLALGQTNGARLVTTEKDWVRISEGAGPLAELKAKTQTLPITLNIAEADQPVLTNLLLKSLEKDAGKA